MYSLNCMIKRLTVKINKIDLNVLPWLMPSLIPVNHN